MPVTIDATVGGSASNAFVTLAEFTAYMLTRLNTDDFDSATTDEQNRAIASATRELNRRGWKGTRVTSTQALSWPRQWCIDPDSTPFASYFFATTVIPQRIKDATCELAFQFLVAGTTDIAVRDTSMNVQAETVGPLTTQYVAPGFRADGLAKYPNILREIRPLLAEASTVSRSVMRG